MKMITTTNTMKNCHVMRNFEETAFNALMQKYIDMNNN